jgi:hypothetical protein
MKMLTERKIPIRGGVFIDAYNQTINLEIAMTITTRGNHYFVTEINEDKDTPSHKERLHRD